MIIVTGAAGFIGSCLLAKLNERGIKDILLVDHLEDPSKKKNLSGKQYTRYYDKKEFLEIIKKDQLKEKIDCLFHIGACSSTTLQDARYFEENNFQYTKILAEWSLKHNVRFIYASSAATYGDGAVGYKDDDQTTRMCKPLNLYGESKQKFDIYALDHGWLDEMVGLKFFNVFGPNEYHKGDMRSVIAKAYERVSKEGKMMLFKSTDPQYKDGEQKRDFVYIKDAIDMVLYFYDHKDVGGIFNVGTGKARTWNDLANALFKAKGLKPNLEYKDMPSTLKNKYQNFTQADMSKIKASGYLKECLSLEDAIADYVTYLKVGKHI